MALSDVADVTQIEQKATPHPWRESQFIDSYEKHHCLALTLDSYVIGYAIYSIVVDEAEILNVAIHPEHQNKGRGRYLLEHLIAIVSENAQRFFLEVRVSNASAIYVYENIGFVEVCQRKNYYQTALTSEDALLMAMEL
tara:strand:- start:209 stop:625 length:417 start_codon:yes stop_codon:yes gene_type:complete